MIFRGTLVWAMLAVAAYCACRVIRIYIESRKIREVMSDTDGLSTSQEAIAGFVGSLAESAIGCELWATTVLGFIALIVFLCVI